MSHQQNCKFDLTYCWIIPTMTCSLIMQVMYQHICENASNKAQINQNFFITLSDKHFCNLQHCSLTILMNSFSITIYAVGFLSKPQSGEKVQRILSVSNCFYDVAKHQVVNKCISIVGRIWHIQIDRMGWSWYCWRK